jgi:TPR repeat protein
MASGDVVAARMVFQLVAEAGEASAAFALAETYDPSVLDKLPTTGVQPDVALARQWYEKAKELGSPAAPGRLVGLTR